MRKISITVYSYDELSEEAKQVAYDNYLTIISHFCDTEPFCNRADVEMAKAKCERLQTPWFFAAYLDEINGENIKKELAGFIYYEDGRTVSTDILENASRIQEVYSVEFNENQTKVYTHPVRLTQLGADINVEEAIKSACREYLNTDEGKATLEENCGYFNIGDFMLNVPDHICQKYGFEKVMFEPETTIFAHNENLY